MSKNDGTGLGLFICKNIIEKMNGVIRFVKLECSENNVQIEFTLPIRITSPSIKNKTILIVDDFAGIRSTKMILETKGFEVDIAKSGKECIDICQKKKYDIILMDKNMNGFSGVETVYHLRNILNYTGIIFGFTGDCFSSVSETFDCSSNGVNAILYKPLEIDDFIEKVKFNIF